MRVGELISALCKYACDQDELLMRKSIDSIEIEDDNIKLYFTDANSADYTIKGDTDEICDDKSKEDKAFWIYKEERNSTAIISIEYRCSSCNYISITKESKCPNCGKNMVNYNL